MDAETLLTRQQLQDLTGLSRNTIVKMLRDPGEWAVKGGTKIIAGEYRLPLSFYHRWLAKKDLALAKPEAKAA